MAELNPAAQAALDALQAIDKGRLLVDLGESLQDASRATRERKKPSRVTVTLELKPSDVGDQWMVLVKGEVKASLPAVPRPASLFFSDEEGKLHRKDPRQQELWAPKSVPATPRDDVDTETGELKAAQ